jgi:hypothetical protein
MTARTEFWPEYRVWSRLRARCNNPKNIGYQNYGGRGISVCPQWNSFEVFLADMGRRPMGHSIDRINNDGNYEPANCRWATTAEQNRNRRDTLIVEFRGERMKLVEAYAMVGSSVPYKLVENRVEKGWGIERALSEPLTSKEESGSRGALSARLKRRGSLTHCRHGHEMTESNRKPVKQPNGKTYFSCRECFLISARKFKLTPKGVAARDREMQSRGIGIYRS